MSENARHRALEINSLIQETETGRIENHALGAQMKRCACVAHAVLAGAQGVDLVALGHSAKRRTCCKHCGGEFSFYHRNCIN